MEAPETQSPRPDGEETVAPDVLDQPRELAPGEAFRPNPTGPIGVAAQGVPPNSALAQSAVVRGVNLDSFTNSLLLQIVNANPPIELSLSFTPEDNAWAKTIAREVLKARGVIIPFPATEVSMVTQGPPPVQLPPTVFLPTQKASLAILDLLRQRLGDLYDSRFSATERVLLEQIVNDCAAVAMMALLGDDGPRRMEAVRQIEAQLANILAYDHALMVKATWAAVGEYIQRAMGFLLNAVLVAI
jgi:hypothetical protein